MPSARGQPRWDAGPPSGGAASCDGGGWTCFHAQQAVTGMVGFHNATAGTELTDWWDNGSNAIAFGRGSKGFVVLNDGDGELQATFATSLPAGTYCDVVQAAPADCDGNTVQVGDDGKVTATVPAKGALALHAGATG